MKIDCFVVIPVRTLGTVIDTVDLQEWVQIWVKWDNGSTLSLATPPDRFEVVV
jgi:hypothetical protein